ncbi:cytochrome b5 domain-containing protein 1 [Neosynchiropus ocellatus]
MHSTGEEVRGAVKDDGKEKRPNFFTPTQVAAHNTTTDLWVSYLGKVCDLTPLAMQHEDDPLLVPILEFAGKDISSWFDVETKDASIDDPSDHHVSYRLIYFLVFAEQLQTYIHPLTNCVSYYTPRGRFLHVPPAGPRSDWATDVSPPWWKDERYVVGRLTVKTRWIRVINTLTSQEQRLEVCTEETMEEILQRYLFYNSHASSYTWKFEGTSLDMSRTLCENNIPDQDMELEQLRLDRDLFTPAILLYFNDDLTEG